jgi:hypothetical protein
MLPHPDGVIDLLLRAGRQLASGRGGGTETAQGVDAVWKACPAA